MSPVQFLEYDSPSARRFSCLTTVSILDVLAEKATVSFGSDLRIFYYFLCYNEGTTRKGETTCISPY